MCPVDLLNTPTGAFCSLSLLLKNEHLTIPDKYMQLTGNMGTDVWDALFNALSTILIYSDPNSIIGPKSKPRETEKYIQKNIISPFWRLRLLTTALSQEFVKRLRSRTTEPTSTPLTLQPCEWESAHHTYEIAWRFLANRMIMLLQNHGFLANDALYGTVDLGPKQKGDVQLVFILDSQGYDVITTPTHPNKVWHCTSDWTPFGRSQRPSHFVCGKDGNVFGDFGIFCTLNFDSEIGQLGQPTAQAKNTDGAWTLLYRYYLGTNPPAPFSKTHGAFEDVTPVQEALCTNPHSPLVKFAEKKRKALWRTGDDGTDIGVFLPLIFDDPAQESMFDLLLIQKLVNAKSTQTQNTPHPVLVWIAEKVGGDVDTGAWADLMRNALCDCLAANDLATVRADYDQKISAIQQAPRPATSKPKNRGRPSKKAQEQEGRKAENARANEKRRLEAERDSRLAEIRRTARASLKDLEEKVRLKYNHTWQVMSQGFWVLPEDGADNVKHATDDAQPHNNDNQAPLDPNASPCATGLENIGEDSPPAHRPGAEDIHKRLRQVMRTSISALLINVGQSTSKGSGDLT